MNRFGRCAMALAFRILVGCQTNSPKVAAGPPPFHVLVMAETGGVHAPFVAAAKI
jgi:hypothetical protein